MIDIYGFCFDIWTCIHVTFLISHPVPSRREPPQLRLCGWRYLPSNVASGNHHGFSYSHRLHQQSRQGCWRLMLRCFFARKRKLDSRTNNDLFLKDGHFWPVKTFDLFIKHWNEVRGQVEVISLSIHPERLKTVWAFCNWTQGKATLMSSRSTRCQCHVICPASEYRTSVHLMNGTQTTGCISTRCQTFLSTSRK